jgi:hypothetical protein
MPYTLKQHRLFEAAAHSPSVAQRVGIPQRDAAHMASEGVKSGEAKKKIASALMRRRAY